MAQATTWLRLSVHCSEEQVPIMELLLQSRGALAVSFGAAEDSSLLEPAPGQHPLWTRTRISALFEGSADADELRRSMLSTLTSEIAQSLQIERHGDRDWARVCIADLRPMRFGKRLWVCPRGQVNRSGDGVVIVLDPGLAFGTGAHPTTALCLEWLDAASLRERRVVDFGCGSGILGIAALRLGARSVIAVDHDPQALQATQANAERNAVQDRLEVRSPEQFHATETDILLANILAGPLIELEQRLAAGVARGGTIVLSGILSAQASAVTTAYRRHFTDLACAQKEEWVRIEGKRAS